MSIATSVSLSGIITPALLFILTLLSGLLLSAMGRPFNGVVFTIHKLIAVGAMIVIGLDLYRLQQLVGTRTFLQLVALGLAGLFFLALVVTGALLSLEIARPLALGIHRVAPVLGLLGTSAAVYLLVLAQR